MTWLLLAAAVGIVLMVIPIEWLLAVVGLAAAVANRRERG
jgi:hypothetical protein